ncbi:RPP25 protein, partial [Polyodon spathula]|nr:ribonuclease P protein subunit p25-like protein [Polyodon spathula]MBN3274239.1 RPP25 protein [Polyodon spathula]
MQSTRNGGLEKFKKIGKTEEESQLPFPELPQDVVEMKVKEGSKIRNLMGFTMSRMEDESMQQIVFSGSGRAITKTITCVEIMKRKVGGLHQVTKLRYQSLREVWESREQQDPKGESSENLMVHKNVPSICILLSKDPLDPQKQDYQPPESLTGLWIPEEDFIDEASLSLRGAKRPLFSPKHSSEPGSKRLSVQPCQLEPPQHLAD